MKTKNKTSKFSAGIAFYIIILLSIIAVVWYVLTLFLQSYEQSQPEYCINEYIATANTDTAARVASAQLNSLSDIQDKTVAKEYIAQGIKDSTPVKYAKETNDEKITYYLYDGDRFIEKVTLVPGNNCGFGFHSWVVRSEEYLPDTIGKNFEISIPENYTISFNGNILNDAYVINSREEYKLLDGFYSFPNCQFPYLKRYSLGELFGDNSILINSPDGKSYLPDEVSEELFLNNCTDEQKAAINEITNNFVYSYVQFLSNSNRNTETNFYYLMQYVDSGSKLESILKDAKKSNGFNSSHGDEIKNITILNYINIDGEYYIADVAFDYITTGMTGTKTEMSNHIKLLLRQSSTGALRAVFLVQC